MLRKDSPVTVASCGAVKGIGRCDTNSERRRANATLDADEAHRLSASRIETPSCSKGLVCLCAGSFSQTLSHARSNAVRSRCSIFLSAARSIRLISRIMRGRAFGPLVLKRSSCSARRLASRRRTARGGCHASNEASCRRAADLDAARLRGVSVLRGTRSIG